MTPVLAALLDTHRTLAYLLFLVALVDLILAITAGRTDPRVARGLQLAERFGIVWAGRINLVLGLSYAVASGYDLTHWWMWVSIVLWGPVEMVSLRFMRPELETVLDGGQATGRLTGGAAIQLVAITIIFGLMSARP